jgi:hypothetical protein
VKAAADLQCRWLVGDIEIAFELKVALASAGMLAGLFVFVELGRWFGARRHALGLERHEAEGGAVDAAVFALFGLLIAFSFSGALERLDRRRTLIVAEANSIETAYRRLDLLPPASQPALRGLFRQYVEARLTYYQKMTGGEEDKVERDDYLALQGPLWKLSIEAARRDGNAAVLSLVGSGLNSMFESEVERIAALQRHPPPAIWAMLFAFGFAAAFLAGYSTAGRPRNWPRVVVFAASLALALFVILNLEFPRLGLVRLGIADHTLFEVLERMN